jgi:4-carboxymuconolactone decarboxylase
MRLKTPRLQPLADHEATSEQTTLLRAFRHDGQIGNLFRTLARHPMAMRPFATWMGYVLAWGGNPLLGRTTLRARERELLILRTGWLCRAGYEWVAHVLIAREVGVTLDEIEWLKVGSSAPGWGDAERLLLQAAEQLHADYALSDEVWSGLADRFSEPQCMDVVYTVAQYTQVSMILNAFGIQLEPGRELDPAVLTAWGLDAR